MTGEGLTLKTSASLSLHGGNLSPFHLYIFSHSYDNNTRDASFTVGLQGIKKEDYPMVVETIYKTFDKVIE